MAGDQEFEIDLDGERVPVSLVRRAQARRYVLRVRAARQVLLTMPAHGTRREALAFAERQRDWLRDRLGKLPRNVRFEDGVVIPFRGKPHIVDHRPEARGTVWIEEGDSAPLLAEDALPRLCVAGRLLHLRRRLREFLERQARADLESKVARYARRLGVSVQRISIRDQKSRWGACSASGTVTFSWRLILAPEFVLDYLAAHEVAHVREMNHSPAYWRLLNELCPHTGRAESWLKANGRDLHRYDPQ